MIKSYNDTISHEVFTVLISSHKKILFVNFIHVKLNFLEIARKKIKHTVIIEAMIFKGIKKYF